jgi:hypothetical protein
VAKHNRSIQITMELVGEITTPLLNTTGKCLMLFHYVSDNDLHFLLHVVDENLTVVLSRDLTSSVDMYDSYTWWPYLCHSA